MNKKVIGIDLGTTNSCVSFIEGQDAKIIENLEGSRTTPSVVFIDKDNKISVGNSALRQAALHPENTVVAVKRLIGKSYNDSDIDFLKKGPVKLIPSSKNDAWIQVNGRNISPQEVSASILRKMKETAESYIGSKVDQAVVTVPAYFNDAQRQATKEAGKIAGLEILRIINEPTAAALAYGLNKSSDNKDKTIAVYDLGGGTFDISIIEISKIDGEVQVQVLATNGDTLLGGEDFDRRIIDFIIKEFKKSSSIDISKDKMALSRVREAAEKAKKELSSSMQTNINLPFITADASGTPQHLNINLTRSQFNGLIEDLIEKTLIPCKQVIEDAKISKDSLDSVLLIGGQTRTPLIKEKVAEFFNKTPKQDINPDEAVAQGAAIQAGILAGDVKDILLLDVTPLSLGIETLGGVMTNLIERNTSIPTKTSKVFTTAQDNQSAVTINILQGERAIASENKQLGAFNLTDIPPAAKGIPQIEVTFDIDANGILHVSAKDKATGKSQAVTVQASGGLSDAEIEQALAQAKQNEAKDRQFKELIAARDNANNLAISIRKHINSNKQLKDQHEDILKACNDLEDIAKGEDKSLIQEKTKKLQDMFSPIMEKAYSASKQSSDNTKQSSDNTKDEDKDEEIVVEDDKK